MNAKYKLIYYFRFYHLNINIKDFIEYYRYEEQGKYCWNVERITQEREKQKLKPQKHSQPVLSWVSILQSRVS